MIAPRRLLPSISWLLSFEAVARAGSVTDAAAELSLTQSAVSRHLQGLEAQLGVPLFRRDRKRLHLTPAGADYARDVRAALGRLASSAVTLTSNPGGGTLELAILPGFGTHWLAPRLPRFLGAHPGVTLNLSTRMRPFDFSQERFQAAIHFGAERWPGTETQHLMEERVVPVAAPDLLARHDLREPEDLRDLPLLRIESRPKAWVRWFAAHGVEGRVPEGMIFDQFATMAQAAMHGLGVALLPDYMAQAHLAEGKLIKAIGGPVTSVGAYALVWPVGLGGHAPLKALREWLAQEAGRTPDP